MPIDILYVGCIAPLQRGGSGVLAVERLSGLTALGHRVRALVSLAPDASAEFQRFVDDHPGIQAIEVPVPVRSSDLLEGSRNPIYRAAQDAGVQAALPGLIGNRRPEVILIGRESTEEIPRLARRHGVPTAALVPGAVRFKRSSRARWMLSSAAKSTPSARWTSSSPPPDISKGSWPPCRCGGS